MGWLRLVGSLKLQVSFAKEPYKRDYILQKRPVILKSLPIVATPYMQVLYFTYLCMDIGPFCRNTAMYAAESHLYVSAT